MKFLKRNWDKLVLGFVIVAAFLVRFLFLQGIPAGFHADEASNGYDAYSVLKTGRDQWGNTMPLVFKSFGDYKLPLYGYLDVPIIALFGLNEFAVRLPSAIIGTLAVVAVYLLVKEILKNSKIAVLAAFLTAVNPWAVMLSRTALETNLVTFFVPMGIFFFLKGVKTYKNFGWSAPFFGLALFTYHSAKIIVPLVLTGLILIYRRELKKIGFRKLAFAFAVFLIFSVGIIYTILKGGGARLAERSVMLGALEEGAKAKIEAINSGTNPVVARILHNKYQVALDRFAGNYFQYFSPRFLFTRGAGEATYGMVPGIGVIYNIEGFLILGLIPFLIRRKERGAGIAVLVWFAAAVLPAALTTGIGYAGNRASGMMPALQILATFGAVGWLDLIKSRRIFVSAFLTGILIAESFGFAGFVRSYFINPPPAFYKGMLYGNTDAFGYAEKNYGDREVIVSRSLSEPQIFAAFAGKVDPEVYQEAAKSWNLMDSGVVWVDQIPSYRLRNYTFKSVDWTRDVGPGAVVIARPEDFPKRVEPSKIITYPVGGEAIWIREY